MMTVSFTHIHATLAEFVKPVALKPSESRIDRSENQATSGCAYWQPKLGL